jgi:uroporphyrin-III C-methyltransferase
LYDALANEELLSYAPKKALKIFVGKRKGSHEYEEINQLIVDNALVWKCSSVKGGDPFIFWSG